jgi:3-hydroxyisobutyrate dehydrogenase-like beta-hydroxyacid dehydrogenase
MMFEKIAILSPGNMGAAVGAQLSDGGYDVMTWLAGRSDYTKRKAEGAGIRDVASLEDLVVEADLILSILDPGKAVLIAEQVAEAMAQTGATPVFADCNATSPATAKQIQMLIEDAAGKFIDVGIIGGAPTRRDNFPNFCTSGADATLLDELDGKGVNIRFIGPEIGQGSAIKICNGAYNKGAFALYTTVMLAAEHYGFADFLRERLPNSQAGNVERLDEAIIRLPSLSERYIGEMEQVAETFASIGLTSHIHQGAAELFELLSASPLAAQRRDEIDPNRTSADTLAQLVEQLDRNG